MFNFKLDPVDQITPWGEPPDLKLHWFGLTSGTYFIQADQAQLLRYSDECCARLAAGRPEPSRTPYVDYFVVRLYEDIFDILPHVLEPIPIQFTELARNTLCLQWREECRKWIEAQPERDEFAWDRYYDSVGWIGKRSLDTAYLSPDARIWFWRFGDTITVEWDNRDKYFEEVPAWAAQQGSYLLSVEQFLEEITAFGRAFIEAMGRRVTEIGRSWSRPDVLIDRRQLVEEQQRRETERVKQVLIPAQTDWSAVTNALSFIQSAGTKFGPG